MSSNLKLRHRTWCVRVKVNPKYSKLIGRTETVRSLKTHDKRTAERIKYGVIQQIKDYHERLIREAQSGLNGQTDSAMDLRLQVESGAIESSDAVEILHGQLEDKLKFLGLTPKQIEALTGDDVDPLVRSSFDIVRDTETLPLSAAIKQYLDLIEKNITPRTWQLYEKQLKLFSEWAGRIQVTDIDRRLSSRYINECMIPKGLAPNTNINNVAALTAFFSWLIDNSLYEKANPFAGKGKTLKGSKQGNHFIANRAWTPEELKALFENTSSQRKGTVKYKAGIAARIALFSGMRQNEVCSIKLTDVNLEEGFIAIPKAKNENSVRQVPIHSEIEPLIRELVETSSDNYLIEGLPTGTRDKKRGHSLGNRFTDLKKEVFPNSAKNELTFHGLRSTFITAMEKAGIPESTAKLIDGHARQSLSYGLYSKGIELDALAEAVAKVDPL